LQQKEGLTWLKENTDNKIKFLEQKVLRCFPKKAEFYPLLKKRIKQLDTMTPKQSNLSKTVKQFVSQVLPNKGKPKQDTTDRHIKPGARKSR
jgi:hypothetical protein